MSYWKYGNDLAKEGKTWEESLENLRCLTGNSLWEYYKHFEQGWKVGKYGNSVPLLTSPIIDDY